jgi:hypothetical protein
MAENAVPGKGILIFGKKPDGTYALVSLASDGSMNISGSITASLGAFNPLGNATLAVTTSTNRVALPTSDKGLVLRNRGSNDAYFKLGSGSVVATTSDFLIKAGDILGLDATGFTNVSRRSRHPAVPISMCGPARADLGRASGRQWWQWRQRQPQPGGRGISIVAGRNRPNRDPCRSPWPATTGNLPVNVAQIGGSSAWHSARR